MKGDEGRVIPFISAHIPISCFGGFSTNLLQTDRRPCESRDQGRRRVVQLWIPAFAGMTGEEVAP